jgi:AraC-like DNA-binding protein
LIISLAAPIQVSQMPSGGASVHQALIGGLRDAPIWIENDGEVIDTLHLTLTPLGVRALFGVPSSAFSGEIVDLHDIMGAHGGVLLDRLYECTSWPERFNVLDLTLQEGLVDPAVDPMIDWAWRRLRASHGTLSVAALAEQSGLSRRHFGERFKSELGLSPKTVARILRFERATGLIHFRRSALADVAAAAGYADQAHMTRDWLAMSGRTPRRRMLEELPFLQDHEITWGDDGAFATKGA